MNAKKLFDQVKTELLKFESEGEAESIAFLILEHIHQLSRMDVLMAKDIEEVPAAQEKLRGVLSALQEGKPIQHILGRVEFYGRQFLVNPNVLIPRRETEELVHLILNEHLSLEDKIVVDIGTGSGIIPITLQKERKNVKVYGLDISSAALATAKRNAALNRAEVNFQQIDILQETPDLPEATIWVSNPPYVLAIEKEQMEEKVYGYEPNEALFIPNNDPLLFYDRICKLALDNLSAGGYLYFEINEQFGEETMLLMHGYGFSDIKVFEDMQGKDRFARGIKK